MATVEIFTITTFQQAEVVYNCLTKLDATGIFPGGSPPDWARKLADQMHCSPSDSNVLVVAWECLARFYRTQLHSCGCELD